MAHSTKYFSTTVAARRTVILEAAEARLAEMKLWVPRIMGSAFITVEKINAIKTFLVPMLDFMLLNGDIGITQLSVIDQNITGTHWRTAN
jgi:hypothetical protein